MVCLAWTIQVEGKLLVQSTNESKSLNEELKKKNNKKKKGTEEK